MTALITDIKPFAIHDGPGVRTTLFFKGCPLKCKWCHNPETRNRAPEAAFFAHKCRHCQVCRGLSCPHGARRLFGREVTVEEILPALAADKVFFEESGGGVTLSGGEPLLQADFAAELLAALKKENIHTAVDTCACVPWSAFEKVIPLTDLFLCDFKHIDSAAHSAGTGVPNETIIENLRRLSRSKAPTFVRVPVICGFNDAAETLRKMVDFLAELGFRYEFLRGHDMARSRFAAIGAPDTMPPTLSEERFVKLTEEIEKGKL